MSNENMKKDALIKKKNKDFDRRNIHVLLNLNPLNSFKYLF